MKILSNILSFSAVALSLTTLTGCAAGAATAGYSLKSQSADSLTADAEQRLVNRIIREMDTKYKS